MITFRVVKSPKGWSIESNSPISTNYLSRQQAIDHANELADVLRSHGQPAMVVVDEDANC